MERIGRNEPLPAEMQGRWMSADDDNHELVIAGGEVTCFGSVVDYDYKVFGDDDGALTVSLKVDDVSREDDFQRVNITELVKTPEGDFLAYNTRFATQFLRVD